MKSLMNELKKIVASAVVLAIAFPVPYARAQAQAFVGQAQQLNNGQIFNNAKPVGAVLNSVTNPMNGALGGYDQCLAEIRMQTRIYNPLVDPVKTMADRYKDFEKKMKEQAKNNPAPKAPTCKKDAKDGAEACKKDWAAYDKAKKKFDKKNKEDQDAQVAENKKLMKLVEEFELATLIPNSSLGETEGAKLDKQLNKYATEEGIAVPGIDNLPTLSCSLLNEKDTPAKIMKALEYERKAIAYQNHRLQTIQGVGECLTKQSGIVQQQVQALTGQFNTQYQQFAQSLTALHAQQVERERIVKQEIDQKIVMVKGEGNNSPNPSMYELKQKLDELLTSENGIWSKSASLQSELMQLEQDIQNSEAFYKADVVATAVACFNGNKGSASNADLRAGNAYGDPQRLANLVGDTLANSQETPSGPVLVYPATKEGQQKAAAAKTDIANRFANLFAKVPQPQADASSADAKVATGSIRTKQSLYARVDELFSGYSFYQRTQSGGFSAQSVSLSAAIKNELNRCFQDAESPDSEASLRRKNAITALEKKRVDVVHKIQTSVTDARKVFIDAANVLQLPKRTPEAYGADMNACLGAVQNPKAMNDCFNNFKGAMFGLSQGRPDMASHFRIQTRFVNPVGAVPGLVTMGLSSKGSRPLPAIIDIACAGLNDCANKIERTKQQLNADIVDLKSDHKKFANFATQSMQNIGFQMSNTSNPMAGQKSLQQSSTDLVTKISMLQNELSNYGVAISSEVPLIPPAEWTIISGEDNPLNGFVERPKDLVSAVAAGTIDYRKNPFGSIVKGVGDARKEVQKKTKAVNDYQTKMKEEQKKCDKDAKEELNTLSKRVSDESGCLLLTGAKLDKDVSTVSNDVYSTLSSIAGFFKGGGSNHPLNKVSGCSELISAGVDPTQSLGTSGEKGLISESELNTKFTCDGLKPEDARWGGKPLSDWRTLKTGNFDASDVDQCQQLKGYAVKVLNSCREKVKSANLDNCATTSQDLKKQVEDAITKYQKPAASQVTGSQGK